MSLHIFEKNRSRQKTQIIVKSVLIIIIGIALVGLGQYYYVNEIKNEGTSKISPEVAVTQTKTLICLDSGLPGELTSVLVDWKFDFGDQSDGNSLEAYEVTTAPTEINECDVRISRNVEDISEYNRIWTKTYVAVTSQQSTIHGLETSNELFANAVVNQKYQESTVIWDQTTYGFISSKYKNSVGQEFLDPDSVHSEVEKTLNTIAIVPFEEIKLTEKVLPIDGNYPFRKDFNGSRYELSDTIWLAGKKSAAVDQLTATIQETLGEENFDPELLKDIILTGSSAVGARGHQTFMVEEEVTFPILGVSDYLKSADISHLSNESSFSETCTQNRTTALYCGSTESIDMLILAGIDVVGLSGNHILDYQRPAFENTLRMYEQEGIESFGGGIDFESAHTAKVMELGEMKVAFLAYNFIGPSTYYATVDKSGNASPDKYFGDAQLMRDDIAKIKEDVDFIIVDMQWGDPYSHTSSNVQNIYGKAAIDAGANIVNGVHSNFVKGIDIYNQGLIFYGLGSFLVDEQRFPEAKEGFMARHIFYKDKQIGFEVVPVAISDDLQTELAEGEIKDRIIKTVFDNSNLIVSE